MMGLVQFHPAGFGPTFWGDDLVFGETRRKTQPKKQDDGMM